MIDFSKYQEDKASGALVLQKIGTRAVLFVRKFDPKNGSELPADTAQINPADVKKVRDAAQAQVAGIDGFLADIEALGVKTE